MAGTTLFVNPNVVHAQYIASTEEGKKHGCLDYLIDHLIHHCDASIPYFDFGTSNENQGATINHGLLEWKEGFGAKSVSHDFYHISTLNYKKLNSKLNSE
jgi:hypothetical protein